MAKDMGRRQAEVIARSGDEWSRLVARGGLSEQCPNLARLLRNVTFTITAENQLMSAVLEDNTNRRRVAKQWFEDNPQMITTWLEGVTRYQGRPASKVLDVSLTVND